MNDLSSPVTDPSVRFDPIPSARLRLEPCAPGDEARLQAVFEAAADHFQALHGAPGPAPDAAAREIAAAAAAPGREVAVIVLAETGEDVGAVGWWRGSPEPHLALLGTLVIVPAHRGRMLGREALAALEGWLAVLGVRGLRTAFPHRRLAVRPVVQALGFREMSIAEHQKLGLAGAGTSLWEKEIGPA